MIIILFLMVASLVLVFLGLATDITIRTTGTSPLVHMLLTYAGLLVTLAVAYGGICLHHRPA